MSYFHIILDRSREKLTEVPEDVLHMTNLQMLYLEGNLIEFLPPFFFEQLPKLKWLDLRSNCLKELPPSIGLHQNLENLLLSDNKLETLPNELGLLPKLKVLQLAYNPIVYPPPEIIEEGTPSIVAFLSKQYEEERKILLGEQEIKHIEPSSSESSALHETFEIKPTKFHAPSVPNLCGKKSFSKPMHRMSRSKSRISVRSSCHAHLVTKEKAEMAYLKDEFLAKVKEMLMEQERILQQEKNLKHLETWRRDQKVQTVIERKEPDEPPYGTYPEYNKMPSRDDLFKQIDKYIEKSKAVPPVDIDKVVKDIMSQLRNIKTTEVKDNGESNINDMTNEINAIMGVHKQLLTLQGKNKLF